MNKSTIVLLASAVVLALSWPLGLAWGEPTTIDAQLKAKGFSGGTVGAAMRQAGLTNALAFISKYLGVSENAVLDGDFTYQRKSAEAGLLKLKTTDGHVLTVDQDTGRLMRYVRLDRTEVPEKVGLKDAISESKAMEIARDFFASQGITIEPQTLRVTFRNIDGNAEPTLGNASWEIRFGRFYQGIRTDSYVRLNVAAYTGEIVAFLDWPLIPPAAMDEKVSGEDALQTVQSFAANRGISYTQMETPALLVVRPNNRWELSELSALESVSESRLCWEVRLINGTQPENLVYVDALTGKIVGGL